MVKKRSFKKSVKKVEAARETPLRRLFGPTLAKIGLALALTATSMLYNGRGMNYYADSMMRGFPLAILTLENGVTYQIILISILVDLIFWYLAVSLAQVAYQTFRRKPSG